jgi:hypothetical protein
MDPSNANVVLGLPVPVLGRRADLGEVARAVRAVPADLVARRDRVTLAKNLTRSTLQGGGA